MKNRFTLLILLTVSMLTAKAQVAVEVSKMNVIYIGLDNPVTISVPEYTREQLILTTEDGCDLIKSDSGYFFSCPQTGRLPTEDRDDRW